MGGGVAEVQGGQLSTALDPLEARNMALTGDHYRTLEAIKQLEAVINDSSQGPADLAQ